VIGVARTRIAAEVVGILVLGDIVVGTVAARTLVARKQECKVFELAYSLQRLTQQKS